MNKDTEPFYKLAEEQLAREPALSGKYKEASSAMADKTLPNLIINPLPLEGTNDYYSIFDRPFLLFIDTGDGSDSPMVDFPNVAYAANGALHRYIRNLAQEQLENFNESLAMLDPDLLALAKENSVWRHLCLSEDPFTNFLYDEIRWPSMINISYHEFSSIYDKPCRSQRHKYSSVHSFERAKKMWLEFTELDALSWYQKDGTKTCNYKESYHLV